MRKIFLLIVLFLAFGVRASHIVGGEIVYSYVSKAGNGTVTYNVKLVLYLDCLNGNPSSIASDATANLNVFNARTGSLIKNLCKNVSRSSPVRVTANAYKCIKNQPNVCVDMYEYQTSMSLPQNTDGYIITFERCCRNTVTVNINNPGNTGATYWTEIKAESVIGKNSSPVFTARPPIFLCLNAPFSFNHSATDADGDSLVYELYTPYLGASNSKSRPDFNNTANGTPVFPTNSRLVSWLNPYSVDDEMGGNPILEIDPVKGQLTITPTVSGQFVVGIKVKEYRKGVLIGETKRDYQFFVSNCVFEVISAFSTPKVNCTNTPIQFSNTSQGATGFKWDFGDPNRTDDTSRSTSPVFTYKKAGQYKIMLVAFSSVCVDTFEYFVTIKETPVVDLGRDTIFCKPGSITLDAGNPGKTYIWNTAQTTRTITVNKTGTYMVSVSDAPCIDRDTMVFTIDPLVFNIGKDTTLCSDVFQPFVYTIPNFYRKYLWSTNEITNVVNVTKAGKLWCDVIDPYNCPQSDTMMVYHLVPPKSNLRDTTVCRGYPADFDANLQYYTYLWSTGETTRKIAPVAPGMYWVKITNGLCSSSDTALLSNFLSDLKLPADTFFCGPFSYTVQTSKPYVTYKWSDGSSTPAATITQAGQVSVIISTKDGCYDTASMLITGYPELTAEIRGDTVACVASVIDLLANDTMVSYLWNTGESAQGISVVEPGTYFVVIANQNRCIDSGFIKIRKNPNAFPNEVYMPNVFTPNGDVLNDLFPSNKFKDINAEYHLQIYNRWGEKLFDALSPDDNWDGTYLGKMCEDDTYVYQLSFLGCDNSRHVQKGSFHLLK